MYELSRIRLYSIGPAGARYADTVLDLRGVGEPVPRPAPAQADFFEDEPTGPPRRPAPAGVLFLENGGGKSVLLKLIFSVMLPGHRNTLGGASSGVLRKFLLADDCGHVALEWQHTLTGETVVVGKVSEWRGRQVSSDPRKFAEAWYSFRPGPGMSLDSLPVAESTVLRPDAARDGGSGARGRRRTMKGFRDILTETGRAYPNLDVVWEEVHERWVEHLGHLGLDPELFRYQREMNADEGEAAGLFAVKNDADFTDLLLRAVTDTRDTDGLADLVHGFAHKLGRREELAAERDFTAGSLDLLARVTEAAGERDAARAVHAAARRRARALAPRLAARGAGERDRAAGLADRVAAAAAGVTAADADRARAARVAAELAYRHASLARAAAGKAAAAQRRELTDARTLHAAWQAAETVLQHRAAADRAARVAAAIREAERDAAPALAARSRAAAALVRALHTAAEESERSAARSEERSTALQAASEAAHRDATTAATEAQRARSESEHLRQRLAEVEQETADAVRAGWLEPAAPGEGGGPLTDPARAALAAGDAERTAVAAWEAARETAARTAEQAREAAAEHARAELAAARAADAAEAAGAALDAEPRAAAALAAEPRLAGLLGLPAGAGPEALTPEELDRGADALTGLLDEALATGERRLFELRTAAADDARILATLGDGGLLPPGPDVLATVEFLGEHGIPALPGWRYLAQAVDPVDHATVLAARPALVDGVVITDPGSHARAREVLAAAALLPRSAVAQRGPGGPDPSFIPPRGVAGGRGEVKKSKAEHRLTGAAAARAEADDAAAEAARARDEKQEAAQRARRSADALAGLASRLRERARWTSRVKELAAEAAEAEARAAEPLDPARAADEDRRPAQRAADDARRTARALRAERAEVSGAPDDGQDPGGTPAGASGGDRSLPDLREAYRSASQLYEKVGVGADLRAEQARAESEESAALAALDRLSNKVRTRAARLLEGPEGADGPSRQAAAARAEALVQLLEGRASAASEQLGRLRGEAERLAPEGATAHIELPEDSVPADAERARALLRTATAELTAHEEALGAAREAHEELAHALRAARDAAGGLEEAAALLRALLRDPSPGQPGGGPDGHDGPGDGEQDAAEPYPGTLAEARQTATDTRRALRAGAAGLAAAEAAVREAGDRLVRHANATRFEQVRTPARQQIRELPGAALPDHAAPWAEAFAPRLRVLTDELAQLERNRDGIVDRLRGLVESSLDTLRSAQRLSRLPEGLGEWSGQEFLRIRFEDPDQATLAERLGEVVDETTRAAVRKNTDLRRDGMSLLLRGVHAALRPRGVAVEILKPDAVLRAERVPVGQMGDVFSGGQLLTAAIALYCTMAALRGNDRGRDRHRHAGTLFLDNPIGRANATYLLELQRAVADALGVQLLYTTGLFDTTALAEFPLVIRLRNDADLRAGLKYIRVEEHLRPGLPRRDPAAEPAHGEITATRVFRRPRPAPPREADH
ncbi:coiled-coil domain-containing protein [Streptomyces specialis]|uniref:hypothetical protein n=1 Tax=Streptomyces specialis TaxID=498367 RepID=UPI00073E3D8E|nr:hypothetical protein [Streptomyces specialis]